MGDYLFLEGVLLSFLGTVPLPVILLSLSLEDANSAAFNSSFLLSTSADRFKALRVGVLVRLFRSLSIPISASLPLIPPAVESTSISSPSAFFLTGVLNTVVAVDSELGSA